MPSAIILAAGQGKRMGNPDLAKVLTPLDGKPLLGYVLDLTKSISAQPVVVVVGHQRDAVKDFVSTISPDATCVVQHEQRGTGHAVQQAEHEFEGVNTDVLILSGDVPLLTAATIDEAVAAHKESNATLTVLTATAPDPTGYGRVVRDGSSNVLAIVEHKDATAEQLAIDEINSGIYLVNSVSLFDALKEVTNSNAQGEYYLTDIVHILLNKGKVVKAVNVRWEETQGINTIADLERASGLRAKMMTHQ